MKIYRCKKCKSTEVQGTLDAWFKVNNPFDIDPVDVDWEGEYEYGFCEACDESGHFWDVVEQIETHRAVCAECHQEVDFDEEGQPLAHDDDRTQKRCEASQVEVQP